MADPAPKPLDGIKVLSFEIQVAGPYCSMMLADQGADVIKVERPGSGDTARGGAPIVTNDAGERQSGYFLRFNRNKRSLTLDLKDERGQGIFRELARDADVVIENFRPGLLDSLGLGYEDLRAENPGLVYATISGFGTMEGFTGPYSGRPAYDIVAQAMGGLMHTAGQADGPPTWLGVALGDIVSGMNAAHAIVLALLQRTRTGQGQYIDVSMYDSMVALAERSVSAYSLAGDVLQRGRELYMAPWGPFACSDGWVALIVATERDWGRFCDAIGRPDLVGVEGVTTSGPERARNMSGELGRTIEAWFADRTRQEATEQLLAAGLPVGAVQTAEDIVACEHLAARQLLIDVPDPVLGQVRLVGPAAKLSASTTPITRPAPRLGEHAERILTEQLGRSAEEVATLRADGVI
ncbi:MAG: CaiB/BaiF CoA transferase family protein [Nitriliruptoraceae bacterium]